MKVSILIPLYNAQQFISDTIKSCLNQKYGNFEVIILDDGSSDNSFHIAEEFSGEKVKVFKQSNRGSAETRNNLLKYASGELIQYLDADDQLHPDKIQNQITCVKNFGLQYLYSSQWGKFANDISETRFNKQKVWNDYGPVDWLVSAWNGGGMMQTACWLTPRKLIEKAGPWDESLKENPADDGEFFSRVILASKGIKFCEGSKVFYREHSNFRVSKNLTKNAVYSLFGNCEKYCENILKVENSYRVRYALMINYLDFIYHFYNKYPVLAETSIKKIKELGFNKLLPYGGRNFRFFSKFIGFENMLKLRYIIKGH